LDINRATKAIVFKEKKENITILIVYVDDMIVTGMI